MFNRASIISPSFPQVVSKNPSSAFTPHPLQGRGVFPKRENSGGRSTISSQHIHLPTPSSLQMCHPDPFDFAQDKGSAKDLGPTQPRTSTGFPARSYPTCGNGHAPSRPLLCMEEQGEVESPFQLSRHPSTISFMRIPLASWHGRDPIHSSPLLQHFLNKNSVLFFNSLGSMAES